MKEGKISFNPKYLTFKRLLNLSEMGNVDDLIAFYKELPSPRSLRIGFKNYSYPQTLTEFQEQITWGQRMFFVKEAENYLDEVLRMFDGWFYPILTGKEFDSAKCLRVGRKALNCNIDELLPFATKMVALVQEMLEFEQKHTAGEVNKTWIAAGGSKLTPFADLLTEQFLADKLKCHPSEVNSKKYADCLVWLMYQKTSTEVEQEYQNLLTLKYQQPK